jgi:hypothetical protein
MRQKFSIVLTDPVCILSILQTQQVVIAVCLPQQVEKNILERKQI